ncbi:MAG: diaminobutyrate--2-oxoglutarate transaminase [Planctomycetota bacterium]
MSELIKSLESEVRGYCRVWPTTFATARGSRLTDTEGRDYVDFFCGAGSLNYGHNNPYAKAALLEYIAGDGIQHSLDAFTFAKHEFLATFDEVILRPRGLNYRVQFTGPTGTNSVEAAIKLARKQKQRSHVVAFTHAYHGHTLGSLALTGNQYYHSEYYGSRSNVTHLPFDGYLPDFDTSLLLEKMISDPSSGVPKPAAVILETVQGEGGINVASDTWLRRVEEICRGNDILLIIDDIQVGNGRTGKFFSFEHSGIRPDLVCLSKSLGGGLPLSVVLIQPDCDAWKPGEHTGTFRGNNLAFVTANAVLHHWRDPGFEEHVAIRGDLIRQRLTAIVQRHDQADLQCRGKGMVWGIDTRDGELAKAIIRRCFDHQLLVESSGADDEVIKVMPALTIDLTTLDQGLQILDSAFESCIQRPHTRSVSPVVSLAPIELSASATPIVPVIS